jgi:hypothetical protein
VCAKTQMSANLIGATWRRSIARMVNGTRTEGASRAAAAIPARLPPPASNAMRIAVN